MSDQLLFSPTTMGKLTLSNRTVMAPMTRSRAVEENTPNALIAEHYAQRATAGLIITEGTSPSPNGLGYARIPGLFNARQVAGWKLVTDAVHKAGGKIVVQLMHTGRVSHEANLPKGARVLAPSAVALEGTMYTDAQGMQPHPVPQAMTEQDVNAARDEYVHSAKLAVEAGFDGVELHAANGYLMEQFLSPQTNTRTDAWGGSVAKRIRFVVETAAAVAKAIGGEKVGIRLSPYGANGGMKPYAEIDETYLALVPALAATGIQYVHVADHSAMGAPKVPDELKGAMRKAWPRTFILAGGYDAKTAEAALQEKQGDLVAFGRPFLANPDLVARFKAGAALNAPDFGTFYTPGPKGYTDYPKLG
jgi:N-ethylmaleimide reductase